MPVVCAGRIVGQGGAMSNPQAIIIFSRPTDDDLFYAVGNFLTYEKSEDLTLVGVTFCADAIDAHSGKPVHMLILTLERKAEAAEQVGEGEGERAS